MAINNKPPRGSTAECEGKNTENKNNKSIITQKQKYQTVFELADFLLAVDGVDFQMMKGWEQNGD